MTLSWVRWLFVIAGLFDFLIGLAFLGFGRRLFDAADVPHPNHWAYINFAALMLVIFGTMFFAVAHDPLANRNLILYGMMLKLSYTGIVTYYWLTEPVPMLFKPFVLVDGIFFFLFLAAYLRLAPAR